MQGASRLAGLVGITAVLAGCGSGVAAQQPQKQDDGLPQDGESVNLDPADFTTKIDNPYFPMAPGRRWIYRETTPDGSRARVVVKVTKRTKRIANGITARIVRDTVSEHGRPVEDTFDYYAQDKAGNIWYLGESTKEYENGKVKTTEGSFEAGVDGAQAGVIMPADPRAGMRYREEYYKGHAEDQASIVSAGEQAEVPTGHYTDVVMTRNVNPLEPKVLEFKFYARRIGPVLELDASGGDSRVELVRLRRPR